MSDDGAKTIVFVPSERVQVLLKHARIEAFGAGSARIYANEFAPAARQAYAIEQRLVELLQARAASASSLRRITEMIVTRRIDEDGTPHLLVDVDEPVAPRDGATVAAVLRSVSIVNRRQLRLAWSLEIEDDEDETYAAEEDEDEDDLDAAEEDDHGVPEAVGPVGDERRAAAEDAIETRAVDEEAHPQDDEDDEEDDEAPVEGDDDPKASLIAYLGSRLLDLEMNGERLSGRIQAYRRAMDAARDPDSTVADIEALLRVLQEYDA